MDILFLHILCHKKNRTIIHLERWSQWKETILLLLIHFLVTGNHGGVVSWYFYRSYELPFHKNNPRVLLVFYTCNSQRVFIISDWNQYSNTHNWSLKWHVIMCINNRKSFWCSYMTTSLSQPFWICFSSGEFRNIWFLLRRNIYQDYCQDCTIPNNLINFLWAGHKNQVTI